MIYRHLLGTMYLPAMEEEEKEEGVKTEEDRDEEKEEKSLTKSPY